ncbi:MAG TPA: SDR family oxidoreductase [Solirubrobacteraceae bacterium]|jgi:2-hydroxycyclohexanecarboxyl-CoA dehydrogenase
MHAAHDSAQRVALVTGGGGGIGAAVCEALVANGRAVAVADLNVQAAEAVAEKLRGAGGKALAVELDVTDATSVRAAVETVSADLGEVSILVNNAGWDELKRFVQTDEAFWQKVIEVNFTGALRLTSALLPGMIESGWGRIVSVSSDAARVGSSLESVYAGAKGALVAFTKSIAREIATKGVTANVVCPGPTDTPLLTGIVGGSADAEKVIAAMTRAVPMKRLGKPEDVAPAVAFLSSEDAGFITGQTLSVSGGLTMA